MTWIRLDVGMPHHPKVIGLSDAGFRLYVSALCYSGEHLTDGAVPGTWLPPRLRRAAPSLVDAHLWIPDGNGGWTIHGYTDWQETRAEVEALAERRSKAGRKGAAARWHPP